MNSEKVKEIKDKLKAEISIAENYEFEYRSLKFNCLQDILTLINELESENERLNECYKVKAYDKLRAENKQRKDRIADLEKENENKTNTITDLLKKQEFYEKEKLTKFAERLKKKAIRRQEFIGELAIDDIEYVKTQDIDETLKEFICSNINN